MKNLEVTKRCSCGCCRISCERYDFDSSDTYYEIMFESDYIGSNSFSVVNRIKSAIKLLFGKRTTYSSVFFDKKEDYIKFLTDALALADDKD